MTPCMKLVWNVFIKLLARTKSLIWKFQRNMFVSVQNYSSWSDAGFNRVNLVHLGGLLSSKAKRAKCSTHKQRVIIMLYNKVCDIVSNISELLEIQLLTDTTILQVKIKKNRSCLLSQRLHCKPDDDSCNSPFLSRFLRWELLRFLWRMSVSCSCVPSN